MGEAAQRPLSVKGEASTRGGGRGESLERAPARGILLRKNVLPERSQVSREEFSGLSGRVTARDGAQQQKREGGGKTALLERKRWCVAAGRILEIG